MVIVMGFNLRITFKKMLSTAWVPASISVSVKMGWIPSSLSNKLTRSIFNLSETYRKTGHNTLKSSHTSHAETLITFNPQQMFFSGSEVLQFFAILLVHDDPVDIPDSACVAISATWDTITLSLSTSDMLY